MAEYIKRAEAMKICEEYSRHCFENNDSYGQDLAEKIEDDIIKIPTADVVEVKHDAWMEIKVIGNGYGQLYYQHKNCPINSTEIYRCAYECCPRCGAKMDGQTPQKINHNSLCETETYRMDGSDGK